MKQLNVEFNYFITSLLYYCIITPSGFLPVYSLVREYSGFVNARHLSGIF